jgi:hypothetical protein
VAQLHAASPCVARPIRNDDSTEKIPWAIGHFSGRARLFDLAIGVCRPVCLRRVSRPRFVGYFARDGGLNSLGVSFRMSAG